MGENSGYIPLRNTDPDKALGSSSDHIHHYCLSWQCGPLTSTWPQIAASTLDIYLVFGGNTAMDFVTDLGLRCRYGNKSIGIIMAPGGGTDHSSICLPYSEQSHGLWTWLQAAAQTMKVCMALYGNMSHNIPTPCKAYPVGPRLGAHPAAGSSPEHLSQATLVSGAGVQLLYLTCLPRFSIDKYF